MSHEELMKLSVDKDFEEARDLVLEGLSMKLKTFENTSKGDDVSKLTINLEPRTNYLLPPEHE